MKKHFTLLQAGDKKNASGVRLRTTKGIVALMLCLPFALLALAADKPAEVKGGNGIVLPPPPATEAQPVTENIHGTTITDPYRWLEDAKSPATRAWIAEQMKYTEGYLSQVKIRPEIAGELAKLERVETYSIPAERGGNYFFKKRLADENQGSLYLRHGLRGADERLVDATKMSADQNTSVQIEEIARKSAVPRKFLEQILVELKKPGIVRSQRGRSGGYSLGRPAKDISFADVLRVTDGPLALSPCVSVMAYRKCDDCFEESICAIHKALLAARDATAEILESRSLASAAAQHTGLPPHVEPWLPGGHVIRLCLAIIAPSGIPEAMPHFRPEETKTLRLDHDPALVQQFAGFGE